MKTGANLQQAGHPPLYPDRTGSRFGNPAEDFQECGFTGTITADNADPVALLDLEGDVF